MLDKLTPWPGQDKIPGRRTPHDSEPTLEPSTRIPRTGDRPLTWSQQLKHEHTVPQHQGAHHPERATPRETAHLVTETSYYCSRCGQTNMENAPTCRACGVRFATLTLPAPLTETAAPDSADSGNED